MSDSSDLASDHSPRAPVNRRQLSESEDEEAPELPQLSRKEYANFKRFLSPSSDEGEDEKQEDDEGSAGDEAGTIQGDEEVTKEISAALTALHKAFPMASQDGDGVPMAGTSNAAALVEADTDPAIAAILRLRSRGTKTQKRKLGMVDWKAVKEAHAMNPPFPDHQKVARVMSKLRAVLLQPSSRPESVMPQGQDIFSHRARVVHTALRNAWDLDTAIDLLQRQPKLKTEKKKQPSRAKSAIQARALSASTTHPASKKKKRKAKEMSVESQD